MPQCILFNATCQMFLNPLLATIFWYLWGKKLKFFTTLHELYHF